ncbi:MAG: exodeoxyribonuclease III [Bacteroidota bacterium]
MLRISSLNLNGIRAAHRKGFTHWLSTTQPDIVCLQELRAHEHQIPNPILNHSYHHYFHTAQQKGYSGVGILCKQEPLSVQTGLGIKWADAEGRMIQAEFENFSIASVYFPSGTTGDERQEMKMQFLEHFLPWAQQQLQADKPILFCGDVNIAHTPQDIHNPKRNKNTSGFLPEEREWMTNLLDTGYIDVLRYHYPDQEDLYSWWSYRAASKQRNKGWRIDYQLTAPALAEKSVNAFIERSWDLSDHAPVTAIYDL